jgi:carbohydrate-selective porin OprB
MEDWREWEYASPISLRGATFAPDRVIPSVTATLEKRGAEFMNLSSTSTLTTLFVDGDNRQWYGRSGDRVGLGFAHAHFSDAFIAAQRQAGSAVTDAESVVELSYQAPLTPWLVLQPDLQCVIALQNAAASNAWVAALRMTLTF